VSGQLIVIRCGKFNKPRQVPIHLSTAKARHEYSQHRDRLCTRPRCASFFASSRGGRLSRSRAHAAFARLHTSSLTGCSGGFDDLSLQARLELVEEAAAACASPTTLAVSATATVAPSVAAPAPTLIRPASGGTLVFGGGQDTQSFNIILFPKSLCTSNSLIYKHALQAQRDGTDIEGPLARLS
jgi:hypothetical protein